MEETLHLEIPDFRLDLVPNIQIRSLNIQNFKAYDDYHMDFTEDGKVKPFVCFIGDNGVGKSTALNALQLIFTRLEGYEASRIRDGLGKCVRHIDFNQEGVYGDKNFIIEAEISSSLGDYSVKIDKTGFLSDHPKEIKLISYRLCYFAKFDQELHQFQLVRDKWDTFKTLFESVTGYEVNEMIDVFSSSDDPMQSDMMEKYVLGFTVKKPHETISHKECSNGERKVIKSFSTMLNLEISPKIILIDDIAMHVALGRHLALIDAMRSCYPDSQIFSTTHSYRMTKCLKRRSQIYDLRIIHATPIIVAEPWRLRVIDEIDDALYKIDGMVMSNELSLFYQTGNNLRSACIDEIRDLERFKLNVSNFLKEVSSLYIIEVMSCQVGKNSV